MKDRMVSMVTLLFFSWFKSENNACGIY